LSLAAIEPLESERHRRQGEVAAATESIEPAFGAPIKLPTP